MSRSPTKVAPLRTDGDAQRAQRARGAVVATQAEGGDESSCFICMETTRERLHVGRVCGCSTLAVHLHCLEDWVNSSTAIRGLGSRLECNICMHAYKWPYELTTSSGVGYSKLTLCRFFLAAVAWLGLGCGLGFFAFTRQTNFLRTVLNRVAIALICIYMIFTIVIYINVLSRFEKDVEARKRRMRPRVKFISSVEDALPVVTTADAASSSAAASARAEAQPQPSSLSPANNEAASEEVIEARSGPSRMIEISV
jgi:hypothetical protein